MDFEPDLSYDEMERDHDEPYEPEYDINDNWYDEQYEIEDYYE